MRNRIRETAKGKIDKRKGGQKRVILYLNRREKKE